MLSCACVPGLTGGAVVDVALTIVHAEPGLAVAGVAALVVQAAAAVPAGAGPALIHVLAAAVPWGVEGHRVSAPPRGTVTTPSPIDPFLFYSKNVIFFSLCHQSMLTT